MARLGKEGLISAVLASIARAGWTITRLTPPNHHPAEFVMSRDGRRHSVRLYVWNLSHGGRGRSADEYRIQITSGVVGFNDDPDWTTLILGWDETLGVFAAFDVRRRKSTLGSSPSIQISRHALEAAEQDGISVQDKGRGDFAAALRPDQMARYIERQHWVHAGMPIEPGDGLREDVIDAVTDRRVAGNFGSPDELQQRDHVLKRLDEVERQIRELASQPGSRGHNNPPELLPQEAVAPVSEAADDIRSEMSKATPDLGIVGKSAGFLRRVRDWVRTGAKELGSFLKQVNVKVREELAKIVAVAILATGLSSANAIAESIGSFLKDLVRWLQIVM